MAITRSGTTTEVLHALGVAGDIPTVAVTADPAAPVSGLAKTVIALEFADERSVVQTRFATSGLALLRAHHPGSVRVWCSASSDAARDPAADHGQRQWERYGARAETHVDQQVEHLLAAGGRVDRRVDEAG